MFYRASVQSYGTGLGLYIVKQSLDKISGSVQMSSEKGKGTKFTIIIPNLKDRDNIVDKKGEKRQKTFSE